MITSHILMIRPVAFAFNPQTAVNNAFQHKTIPDHVQEEALNEFDNFVQLLRNNNIKVEVIQDTGTPHTPDSIFPNNWVSFHKDGTIVLYPMFANNRRLERDKQVIEKLSDQYFIRTTINLTDYEHQQLYLEGTGSLILDRDNYLTYACLSPRTSPTVIYDFCDAMGYRPVLFNAVDEHGKDIYHTNVMMCLAEDYVVICMDAIKEDFQKRMMLEKFEETGKSVVYISLDQMHHFAGNMLQVKNNQGAPFLVMSTEAFNSLSEDQVQMLQSFNPIIHAPLKTIEKKWRRQCQVHDGRNIFTS